MKSGLKSLDPAYDLAALETDFRKNYYRKPADDPITPTWKPGDFFGKKFGAGR